MKKIVCDSSSIISLGNICSLDTIPFLKENYDIDFIIPKTVKEEVVDSPMHTKRYKLKAIHIKRLVDQGYLTTVEKETIEDYGKRLTDLANELLTPKGKDRPIKILHKGEAQAIGIAEHLETPHLLIDERNTRLLIENIEMLKDHVSNQTKKKLDIDEEIKKKIKVETENIDVLRSSELITMAYENDYFPEKNKDLLEGSLYGLKFAGCGIKNDEIEDYMNMIN